MRNPRSSPRHRGSPRPHAIPCKTCALLHATEIPSAPEEFFFADAGVALAPAAATGTTVASATAFSFASASHQVWPFPHRRRLSPTQPLRAAYIFANAAHDTFTGATSAKHVDTSTAAERTTSAKRVDAFTASKTVDISTEANGVEKFTSTEANGVEKPNAEQRATAAKGECSACQCRHEELIGWKRAIEGALMLNVMKQMKEVRGSWEHRSEAPMRISLKPTRALPMVETIERVGGPTFEDETETSAVSMISTIALLTPLP